MLIKVCGMREPGNIREVENLGIDLMGFIFYPMSKRHVPAVPEYLPARCRRVGVFVNASLPDICSKIEEFGLDAVQLHGDEPREFCQVVKAAAPGIQLIKAIPVATAADLDKANCYKDVADYILLETKSDGYGGSGRQFDWSILSQYACDVPFILSGGISADDAERILAIDNPRFAGIDLNSRFESAPAVKEIAKLKEFIAKLS